MGDTIYNMSSSNWTNKNSGITLFVYTQEENFPATDIVCKRYSLHTCVLYDRVYVAKKKRKKKN